VVTFPALASAFIVHGVEQGFAGFLFSFYGCLTGTLLLLIPFLMGGMGAGDVKLMAVIGAMQGAVFMLTAFLYIAILGGLFALVLLVIRKSTWVTLKQAAISLILIRRGIRLSPGLSGSAGSIVYPYGVAITVGTSVAIWQTGGWFG
jgi:prepilin peptidase CpaA